MCCCTTLMVCGRFILNSLEPMRTLVTLDLENFPIRLWRSMLPLEAKGSRWPVTRLSLTILPPADL